MFDFRSSVSVLTLYVAIGSTIGVALPPSSLTRWKSKSFVLSEEKSAVEKTQCECVFISMCKSENVAWPTAYEDINEEPYQCPNGHVCCKLSHTEPPYIRSTSLQKKFAVFPLEMGKLPKEITTTEETITTGIIDQQCECVSFDQCDSENIVNNLQAKDECPMPEVCCKSSISTSISPSTDPTPPNNSSVIIYGLSDDDELKELKCECVPFFECSDEDFIQMPTAYSNGDECPMPNVCCKKSTSTSPSTSQPANLSSANKTKVITYGLSEDDERRKLECECVLFSECSDEDFISLPTAYNNGDECPMLDVCCKRSISKTTEPTLPYDNPKIIIYELSKDNEPGELRCECMAPYICPIEDVIELPTTYNNIDQCSTGNICCRRSTWPSTLSLLPQTNDLTPSNTSVIIYGISGDDENKVELTCDCVMSYLCLEDDVIDLPTPHNAKDQCLSSLDVCCKNPITSVIPEPSKNMNKIIAYGLSDDDEARQLECECIAPHICPAEDVIELPTIYNIKDQCSGTNICCKYSTPSLIPQTTEFQPSSIDKDVNIKFSHDPSNTDGAVISIGLSDHGESGDVECECTALHQCPIRDIVFKLSTISKKIKSYCLPPEICCKKNSFPQLISQPPGSSLSETKVGPNITLITIVYEYTPN